MNRVFFKGIKGGTGTTSIIANIATLLAQSKHNVVCIELDKKNELGLHFGHHWHNQSGWSDTFSSRNIDWNDVIYINEDNVKYLPFGVTPMSMANINKIIVHSKRLSVEPESWLLFDVPSDINIDSLALSENDITINLINCDPSCYSQVKKDFGHSNSYYLLNRFNASNTLELDIYQIWRANLKHLVPFFIHFDSSVPEALSSKNVLVNCFPLSVVKEDIQALASWLNNKRKKMSELL